MKRDFRLPTLVFRLVALVLCLWLLTLATGVGVANPYEAIVGRNVFGLNPPTPNVAPPPPPAAAATTITLLGISTILDRQQVMFRVKTAARPPEPAKEQSYLMTEGQGEGGIEVLAIDAVSGTVKIKNQDEPLTLTMKDDAERPTAGAALPTPGVPKPQVPRLPGVLTPSPMALPPANSAGRGRTIPTRSLRTSATSGAGAAANLTAQQQMAARRSPEETAVLYEINREKNELLRQSGISLPRLPQHPFFKGAQ